MNRFFGGGSWKKGGSEAEQDDAWDIGLLSREVSVKDGVGGSERAGEGVLDLEVVDPGEAAPVGESRRGRNANRGLGLGACCACGRWDRWGGWTGVGAPGIRGKVGTRDDWRLFGEKAIHGEVGVGDVCTGVVGDCWDADESDSGNRGTRAMGTPDK